MVKLSRGGRRPPLGRPEPVPLFPPGELPVFGPPPANLRRPMPPRGRCYAPPPMCPPPHIRPPAPLRLGAPPLPLPAFPSRQGRQMPPVPPVRPLLQTPILPPRGLPYMPCGPPPRAVGHRGRGRGPPKRLAKNFKKIKNKKPKPAKEVKKESTDKKPESSTENDVSSGNESKVENPLTQESNDKANEEDSTVEQSSEEKNVEEAKEEEKEEAKEQNDGEFYCETCDRGWGTQSDLDVHLSEHVTCQRDGCSFSAAPKLVELHIRFQHDSGLYKKISSCDGDLQKWIEERKKNYPTKENIERKTATITEMEERGERICTKDFRKTNCPPKGEKRPRRRQCGRAPKRPRVKTLLPKEDEVETMGGLKPFAGVGSLDTPSDDEDVPKEEEKNFNDDLWIEERNESKSNTLSLLAAVYASEDSDGEAPEEVTSKNVDSDLMEDIDKAEETQTTDQSAVVDSTDIEPRIEPKSVEENTKKSINDHRHGFSGNRKTFSRKGTLLEMLLKDEIRRERNIILQCIKYCVTNGFFANG